MNVIKLCRKENIANHEEDHSGFHLGSLLYLPLFFSFCICLWWCQMLTLFDLTQSVQYFQWSAVTGCLFQLLIWSLWTRQSGLSTAGWGWIPPKLRAIFSPQAAAAWREVVWLSRRVTAYGGWLSTHPGGYFLRSLPKDSMPRLSSVLSGPPCPPLSVIYCLWLSLSVFHLITRTQQSGLSTKGPGQRPSWG